MGLQELLPGPARGPGIDLQQVQSLVEEMGTSLSPGAQDLMDMVQFQQRVKILNSPVCYRPFILVASQVEMF